MFGGNKAAHCRRCGKTTTWVRCPNCNGRGPTTFTTCKLGCDAGYKCENGKNDAHHG